MSKLEKEDLIEVTEELQELCDFEDPALTTKGKSTKKLIEQLEDAFKELKPKEIEKRKISGQDISNKVFFVFEEIGLIEPDEEEEGKKASSKEKNLSAKEQKEARAELEEEVEDAETLKDLKQIVKHYDEFDLIRNKLASYGSIKSLKKTLLGILDGSVKIKEEKKTEKRPTTAAAKKGGPKKPGIIATIVECLEKASKKNGVTKEKILETLVKKFPDRAEESMQKTINVQVPSRISKEKFPVEKTKKGGYYKA